MGGCCSSGTSNEVPMGWLPPVSQAIAAESGACSPCGGSLPPEAVVLQASHLALQKGAGGLNDAEMTEDVERQLELWLAGILGHECKEAKWARPEGELADWYAANAPASPGSELPRKTPECWEERQPCEADDVAATAAEIPAPAEQPLEGPTEPDTERSEEERRRKPRASPQKNLPRRSAPAKKRGDGVSRSRRAS
eukprot:TRINITY_DN93512_c0_g1_i1.p2 TRINITY_DN93512_c0_g1~~TRINITY_DN93512_c0_g1_i1.p2  ORF type:complete len:196 (-),score=36.02 TRINITY_DN93512_c0_g1_i1:227-814(-)